MIKKYHILIVEDDRGTLDILSLILLNNGYTVTADPTAELEFLKTGISPDLILLDNHLGEKSGVEICRNLKNNEATRFIPVILESGNDDVEFLASNACADDYLSKPFCIKTLLEKVASLLAKKEMAC